MPIISGSGRSSGGITTLRKVTAKAVASSVTETDLLNGEITIAAGTLTSTGIMRMTAWGDWLQNATAGGPLLKFKFGATTVFSWTPFASITAVANSASRWSWAYTFIVCNANAANAQTCSATGYISSQTSTAGNAGNAQPVTTGEGLHGAVYQNAFGSLEHMNVYNSAAIDTTQAVAVTLTTTNAANSANYDVTLRGALVEIF